MNLARDLACALDVLAFASACGLPKPDPWQKRFLTSTSKRSLLNCCRQSGKSTITSIKALHESTFTPESLVLLLSPSLRQSSELFRKVMMSYRHAQGVVPPIHNESTLKVEFKNGSRIISLPGSEPTIRGFSAADLVIADEASRISDELRAAVSPTLAISKGSFVALSTPAGRRGWWYTAWETGGEVWDRYQITAPDVPRINPEFLAEERLHLGELVFRQEYLCEFIDDSSMVFASELIEQALSSEVLPLWPVCSPKAA